MKKITIRLGQGLLLACAFINHANAVIEAPDHYGVYVTFASREIELRMITPQAIETAPAGLPPWFVAVDDLGASVLVFHPEMIPTKIIMQQNGKDIDCLVKPIQKDLYLITPRDPLSKGCVILTYKTGSGPDIKTDLWAFGIGKKNELDSVSLRLREALKLTDTALGSILSRNGSADSRSEAVIINKKKLDSVDDILNSMSSFYSKLDSFKLDYSADNMMEGNRGRADIRKMYNVIIQRPNKLSVIYKTGNTASAYSAVCDGNNLHIISHNNNQHTEEIAPTLISDLRTKSSEGAMKFRGATFGLGWLLCSDIALNFKTNLTTITYVGEEILDGKYCYKLHANIKRAEWDVWIESGDQPLLRRMVFNKKADPASPDHTSVCNEYRFDQFESGVKYDDSVFIYKPSDYSVKITGSSYISKNQQFGLPVDGTQLPALQQRNPASLLSGAVAQVGGATGIARALINAMINGDQETISKLYSKNDSFYVTDLDRLYNYFNNHDIKEYSFQETVQGREVVVTRAGMSPLKVKLIQKGRQFFWVALLDSKTLGY